MVSHVVIAGIGLGNRIATAITNAVLLGDKQFPGKSETSLRPAIWLFGLKPRHFMTVHHFHGLDSNPILWPILDMSTRFNPFSPSPPLKPGRTDAPIKPLKKQFPISSYLSERSEHSPAVSIHAGHRVSSYLACHAAYLGTILACFATDIALPRGATVAIGYCLVPVLVRRLGDRLLLIYLTAICTILTWIGYILEPLGAAWWMSFFDRAMVTGVLWLTLLLVWRQMDAEIALRHQAQELQNAVEELNRSNAELLNFASIVSHDLRGPLYSISLFVHLISTRPAVKSDAECNGFLDAINTEITRMRNLMGTLLAYGRIGAAEVNLSDCNCESVLAGVCQSLRAELESAAAEVTNDPLPVIRADPTLLAELFQNLIENGIKYRQSAPPRIHVSVKATPDGWHFSVCDNGIGLAPGECASVFDPFNRGSSADSSTGYGLGLATCKRIVARHGGRIEVQSDRGHGSTFSFVIPDPGTSG